MTTYTIETPARNYNVQIDGEKCDIFSASGHWLGWMKVGDTELRSTSTPDRQNEFTHRAAIQTAIALHVK